MVLQTRKKKYQPLQSKNREAKNQMETKLTTENQTNQVQNQKDQTERSTEEETWKEQLEKLYHDIDFTGSYSSKLSEFLRTTDTPSKFKPIKKRNFPRRKVIARFPYELFMADLFEYPYFTRVNRGWRYGLVIIDCFSRKIFYKSLKKKNASTMAEAFDSVFKDFDELPVNIVTDSGTEFFNSAVSKVFDSFGIVHYKTPTKTRWKASMAERAIRTLKSRLAKIFYRRKNNIWYDVIDKVVSNYNHTTHRSHGRRPIDVTDENRDDVYKKLYPKQSVSVVCKFKIGDKVRKIREKTLFEKGYTQNWSDEIFIISSVRQSRGVCWYKLTTLDEEQLPGIWYYYQLNLVSRNVGENQREND